MRKTITMLLLLSTVASATTRAADCEPIIKACDKALAARKAEVAELNLALTQSREQVVGLNTELERREQQLQSPFRNPFIMTTLGVVLGIVVTGYALKK